MKRTDEDTQNSAPPALAGRGPAPRRRRRAISPNDNDSPARAPGHDGNGLNCIHDNESPAGAP